MEERWIQAIQRGMVHGMSILEAADLLGFTGNDPRKYPANKSSLGENTLLMPEVRGE